MLKMKWQLPLFFFTVFWGIYNGFLIQYQMYEQIGINLAVHLIAVFSVLWIVHKNGL